MHEAKSGGGMMDPSLPLSWGSGAHARVTGDDDGGIGAREARDPNLETAEPDCECNRLSTRTASTCEAGTSCRSGSLLGAIGVMVPST